RIATPGWSCVACVLVEQESEVRPRIFAGAASHFSAKRFGNFCRQSRSRARTRVIRKSVQWFSLATNAERVCAEIMRNQISAISASASNIDSANAKGLGSAGAWLNPVSPEAANSSGGESRTGRGRETFPARDARRSQFGDWLR